MKIGIYFALTTYGGVQSCIIALVKQLNKQGITPVLIWEEPPNAKILDEHQLRLDYEKVEVLIGRRFLNKLPHSLRYLLTPLSAVTASKLKGDYDFIYLFTNTFLNDIETPYFYYVSGPPFLPDLYPSQGIKGLRYKLFRLIYLTLLKPSFPVYEFHYDEDSCAINSEFTANLFYKSHNKRLQVIYPPTPSRISSPVERKLNRVICLSRLAPYKRQELMLELAEAHPAVEFLIAGTVTSENTGYLNYLRHEINVRNLKNVDVEINCSESRLDELLRSSTYYFFAAVNEHFGITTVEAIMAGVLPFVHDSGGQVEIVPDERLRFTDETMMSGFANLTAVSPDERREMLAHLARNAAQFSEIEFVSSLIHRLDKISTTEI